MRSRRLGKDGPETSALGFGCLSLTDYYGAGTSREDGIRIIDAAIDAGVTLFDTAPMYGNGENERLLGSAVGPRRNTLLISTKFGTVSDANGRAIGIDGRPTSVRESCDASLTRLRTDVIDIFFQHRLDKSVPIEETVGAMADLVGAGKVRHLGLCEISAATLRRAHAIHPIAAVQSEYSLWTRDPEASVLPTCRELGVGFVAYSPLGRGFLTAAITDLDGLRTTDARRAIPRFQKDNFASNRALVTVIETTAGRRRSTPAQVALAWLLSRGDDIVPIPGTKSVKYLHENLGAAESALMPEEREDLERAFGIGRVAGQRVSETSLLYLDR